MCGLFLHLVAYKIKCIVFVKNKRKQSKGTSGCGAGCCQVNANAVFGFFIVNRRICFSTTTIRIVKIHPHDNNGR